ncbi:DUF2345 domain-containing protein [Noviherbaspirillum sp. UKPF54]|nr:DUF2345 domain-containing protein [Noviherbaspirillum sp. UKPF54]
MPARLDGFSSDTRLYEIETPLGPDRLLVECWFGRERLSALYEWRVFCLAADVHLELKSLVAQQVFLRTRLADGTQAVRSGWVSQVEQLGADGGFARYCLTVVPWLWLATQRRNSRALQDKSVLGIVEEVFAADGERANWRIAPEVERFLARVRPRSYCCQYRESDYAFVARLLAEEGIGFYFEEDPDSGNSLSRQRLVLFADSSAFADDYSSGKEGALHLQRNGAAERRDSIQALGSTRRLPSAITTVSTWDYRAKHVIAASLPSAQPFGGGQAPRVESCDWAGVYAFASADEAEHYARILREAADAGAKTWFGDGGVRTFRAGRAFDLAAPLGLALAAPDNAQGKRFALLDVLHAGVNNLPVALKEVSARLGAVGPAACGEAGAPMGDASSPHPHGGADCDDHFDPVAWSRLREAAEITGYANRFAAIRADVPWRPALYDGTGALLNPKPTAWGSQTAIVVGPDGSTADAGTVHSDRLGRIRIRFHWQHNGDASCWVRVAQMFAGPGYGAQFIPRIGQEVLVKFFENDIDRPIVTGVLYNGQGQDADDAFAQVVDHVTAGQDNKIGSGASPAWHGAAGQHRHAGYLSGFKSVALGADGYTRQSNQLIFDDTAARLRTSLATDTAATQLNLGHLIHQSDNYRGSFRGSGWELRTDAYGAVRAGKGILISTGNGGVTGAQPESAGDNAPGIALLKQARDFANTFNQSAAVHQTVQFVLVKGGALSGENRLSRVGDGLAPIDAMLKALSGQVDAQDGSMHGPGPQIPHMHQPLVVVTAQAGIGVAAADGLHVAAGEVAHFASGRDTQIAAGDTLTLHTGQALGLLAGAAGAGDGNTGIQLYAGQGDVELQAQDDGITLAAKETVKLASTSGHVDFAAAKSITLCTEGGASMTIEGGNITFACPGTISIRAASKSFGGPANICRDMPAWSTSKFDEKFVIADELTGEPLKNQPYRITLPDKQAIEGITNDKGETSLATSAAYGSLKLQLLPKNKGQP